MDKFEILVAGTGGQGVLVVGNLLDRAARFDGFETVIGSEIHGMAQRGGPLVSFTRIGEDVHGPIISVGSADVIISLEYIECLRNIDRLADNGYMIAAETSLPSSMMWLADITYPEKEEIFSAIKQVTDKVIVLNPLKIARDVGNVRTANIVMLGAASTAVSDFPIAEESLRKAVEAFFPAKLIDLNLHALEAGMKAAATSQ